MELKIFNEEEFQHYYGPAFLKFSVTKRYSKYDFNQIIVFCRHLVSLTRPITIEQLGQHYAMSPSNLRNYISRAKPYLATFHLTIPPHMAQRRERCGDRSKSARRADGAMRGAFPSCFV